ncbi:hypothetical protein KFE19_14335 [Dysosmobacter sp. Marseille-Q4140]|nr:hypothetical protein KFE19_14335 [Dysosmobacter sp. Marseille-Q4140]
MVLEDALVNFLEQIQENAPHFTKTPGETVTAAIFSIASAKKKLKAIREQQSLDFTSQEVQIMYWAVSDMRDHVTNYLDEAPLSDSDRNIAIETQKTCNRLLREFSNLLRKDGIPF